MKKLLIAFLFVFATINLNAQFISLPDTILRNYLKQKVPNCFSGNLLNTNTASSTYIDTIRVSNMGITSLEGLQYFLLIDYINCSHNLITQMPATLDAGTMVCSYNLLTSFEVTYPRVNCSNNQISSLTISSSVIHDINCSNNLLTTIPPKTFSWTGAWTYFNCANNMISSLPAGYGDVFVLDISNNNFTQLPALGFNLTSFYCSGNVIDTINIAATCPYLQTLYCSNCQLKSLGSYPGLNYLDCSNNELTYMPLMNPYLLQLNCSHNQLTSLQQSPTQVLNCSYNPINCLPVLGNYLNTLVIDSTFITCLPNIPLTLSVNYPQCNSDTLTCETFPVISGKVFLDVNGNNIEDSSDYGLPHWITETQPNNWYGSSDSAGNYYTLADTGMVVTVAIPSPPSPYYTVSPSSYNFNFSSLGVRDTANDFAVYPTPNANDLKLDMYGFEVRPGFTGSYYLSAFNIGTTVQNAQVKFTFNDSLTVVSTLPIYDSISGNTLFWNIPSFTPLSCRYIRIDLSAKPTLPLGYSLMFSSAIFPVSADLTPADNFAVVNDSVVGSFDPNAKYCSKHYIGLNEVADEVWLEYVIQFQNTGTYTAYDILIKDTLPTYLNLSTMQITASSHPYAFRLSEHGIADFRFANIMLPDSVHDEPHSHGFIKYRIRCKNNLQVNDQIENTSSIYFDYNTPVQTNTALTSVVNSTTGLMNNSESFFKIYPNPVNNLLTINSRYLLKKITVYDVNGRQLSLPDYCRSGYVTTLNTEYLKRGVYTVCLETMQGVYYSKIVK